MTVARAARKRKPLSTTEILLHDSLAFIDTPALSQFSNQTTAVPFGILGPSGWGICIKDIIDPGLRPLILRIRQPSGPRPIMKPHAPDTNNNTLIIQTSSANASCMSWTHAACLHVCLTSWGSHVCHGTGVTHIGISIRVYTTMLGLHIIQA